MRQQLHWAFEWSPNCLRLSIVFSVVLACKLLIFLAWGARGLGFNGDITRLHYVRRPFQREPDFGVTSVNYELERLLDRAEEPA